MEKITKVQLPTKNEKFINALKNASNNKQLYITYWCKPSTISKKNEPNTDLIEKEIDITNKEDKTVLATGVIEDVFIDTVYSSYNDSVIGGNKLLGLPSSYDLDDWIYEINQTLETSGSGPYDLNSSIGLVYIKLVCLPIDKKEEVRGNQSGRKY